MKLKERFCVRTRACVRACKRERREIGEREGRDRGERERRKERERRERERERERDEREIVYLSCKQYLSNGILL